jgi:uncharacterized protein (UPF0332 family)
MSILKTKSDENIDASNKLIKSKLFPSSVHCAYYASVQLMLHILRSHFGKTELQIRLEGINGSKTFGGYHKWLQNLIFTEFTNLNSIDAAKFNSNIKTLSAVRVKADYDDQIIIDTEALKAYDKSVATKKLLQKHFQI